jgi:MFS family permease
MFYQLKSFDPSLSDSTVSTQAGWMAAGFTAAQFLTAFMWGRAADSELLGRKKVVLIGLFGTMISALGFGFSTSFISAILFRCIGGALNGNVGVMRVMISEIIKEKRFQSRAFMMLPMTFNIGVIIGPILGGVLSDPVGQYPQIFGPGSRLGGKDGVWWMRRWPYALPNIISAIFLLSAVIALFLGLEEVRVDHFNYSRTALILIRHIHYFDTSQTSAARSASGFHECSAGEAPLRHIPRYRLMTSLPIRPNAFR